LLFILSCLSFTAATLAFSRIEEMPDSGARPRHSLKAQLARAPALFGQNATFRRYLLVRVLLDMIRIAAPFYSIFALDILGASSFMVGFYLAAMTLAEILANLLWQRIARVRGTLYMLRIAGLLTMLTPLLAATLPWLMQGFGFTVESHGLLPAYLFTGVFLLAGSSQSGRAIGLSSMLLNVAPDEERASYIGLANTVLGFVSLLPIVSGAVIDRVGFEPVFFAATGLISLGYVAILRWKPDSHPELVEG
jgi:MFS family permease